MSPFETSRAWNKILVDSKYLHKVLKKYLGGLEMKRTSMLLMSVMLLLSMFLAACSNN
ncbi:hypothetical protein GNF98_18945, partial [Clostridium perfringens]